MTYVAHMENEDGEKMKTLRYAEHPLSFVDS